MPEEGITYVDRSDLLTFEELGRITKVFAGLGINKIRITGGEPFLRKGIMQFLDTMVHTDGIHSTHITTNGTLTHDKVEEIKDLGISSVNLSLDSLNPERFQEITRRDTFDQVMTTLTELIEHDIPTTVSYTHLTLPTIYSV